MLRKLAIAIAASGAMSAAQVYALGLGEIELDSALNQPLDARIKLVKASELENWEIKPSLASADEFEQAGVERVFFLNGMKFEVERQGGDVFINLSTQQPVVEPFLNFLVQVDWPNGRLLREYTLLLDPPVFNEDQPAQPVAAPVQAEVEETPLPGTGMADVAPEPVPTPVAEETYATEETQQPAYEEPAPVVEEPAKAPVAQPQNYEVQTNDTLWEIALEVRPDRRISPQQVMLAIQDENPDAFIRGNINRLKKNQVLRIPSEEQMRSRSFRQAVAEVGMQNDQFAQRRAQLDATRKSQLTNRDDSLPEAQLKLLADGSATSDAERQASGEVYDAASGDQSRLDQELSLALENLDKANLENQELRSRLESLEEQINTLQRLVNLKDEQMVALQTGMSDVAVVEAPVAESPMPATDAMETPAESDAAETPADLNFAEQPAQAVEAEPAPQAQEPAPKPAVLPPPMPAKGPMDFVMENLPLVGGGLGAILLALLGLRALRNRKSETEDEKESAFLNDTMQDLADHPMDGNAESLDDDFADLELGDEMVNGGMPDMEGSALDLGDAELPDALEEQHESNDVLGEAEMYMAYGRLDRARDLLETTLASEPARSDLRMKLLEILSEQDDAASFAEHFAEIDHSGDDLQKAKASQLRASLSNPDVANLADSDLSGGEELDFSEFETDDLGLPEEEQAVSALEESGNDLDFDLDSLEMDAGADVELTAPTELDNEFDNGLDFELNLDSDDSLDDQLAEAPLDDALELDVEGEDMSLDFDMGEDAVELESDDLALDLDSDLPTLDGESDDLAELSLGDELDDDMDLSFDSDLPTLDSDDGAPRLDLGDDLDVDLDGDLASDLDLDQEMDLTLDAGDDLSELDALSAELGDDLGGELGEDDLSLDLDVDTDDVELETEDLSLAELEAELDDDLDLSELEDTLDAPELSLDVEDDTDSAIDLDLDEPELELAEEQVPELTPELDVDVEEDLAGELDVDVAEEPVVAESAPAAPATDAAEAGELSLEGLDDDLDFLSGTDESETKLDLARAYIDMDDKDGAREILNEVMEEGNDDQRKEASKLLDGLS